MWICLASLPIPGSWSVAICVNSIVLPSGILDFISLSIIIEAIVGVDFIDRCVFAPDSVIAIMSVLVVLGGVLIWSVKLISGLLILILLSISLNRHSHHFSLPHIIFLNRLPLDVPLSLLGSFPSRGWNWSRKYSSRTFFLESLGCFVLRQVLLVAPAWRSSWQSSVITVPLPRISS